MLHKMLFLATRLAQSSLLSFYFRFNLWTRKALLTGLFLMLPGLCSALEGTTFPGSLPDVGSPPQGTSGRLEGRRQGETHSH